MDDEKVKCRKLDIEKANSWNLADEIVEACKRYVENLDSWYIEKLNSRNLAVEIVEAWNLYVENLDSRNIKFKKRIKTY